jgi:hypothetical protein
VPHRSFTGYQGEQTTHRPSLAWWRARWRARVGPGGSGGRSGPVGRGVQSDAAGRYGLLLLLLVVTYLLSASGIGLLVTDLQTVLFLGVMLLVLRTTRESHHRAELVIAAALVGTAAATAATLTHTRVGEGAADVWKGLILLLTAVLIVRRVLARPTVTLQSIYGALSAYLILGLMFAAFYAAIQRLGAGPFFARQQPANTQTFQYFSFSTLTTLGYGDFTAAGNGGRALAVIEALTGQVFLATLVARLVAVFRATPAQPPRPVAKRRWPPPNAGPGSRISYRRKPPGTRKRSPPRDQ